MLASGIGSGAWTRSAVAEMELSHPLKKLVELVDGPDASGQQTLLQRLGRAAVIVSSDRAPQSALDSGLRRPAGQGQGSGGRSARVQVGVRLEEAPEVAVGGYGVFQDGRRQQSLLIRRHALHHNLFQQILQAGGQVNGGVTKRDKRFESRTATCQVAFHLLVNELSQSDVAHPAMEAAYRELQGRPGRFALADHVTRDGKHGGGA